MVTNLNRFFVVLLAVSFGAASTAPANAYLTSEGIKSAVSGKVLTGINDYGNPYTITVSPDGRMTGILGKLNQYDDQGSWTVENDAWCMQWELWSNSERICYKISVTGDKLSRYKPDGSLYEVSTVKDAS